MAKTTTVTTSYTSDIAVNGTAISADKIYVNGTQVRRCIVNDTDVIHKFTRTVVTANSNLTFTFTVRFTCTYSTLCGFTISQFSSPIYIDVKITDNAASGFTSITGVAAEVLVYCPAGDMYSSLDNKHYYRSQLINQSFTIGQSKTLTFSYFQDKYIEDEYSSIYEGPFSMNIDLYAWTDPDGVNGSASVYVSPLRLPEEERWYNETYARKRVVNNAVISDKTVQEY